MLSHRKTAVPWNNVYLYTTHGVGRTDTYIEIVLDEAKQFLSFSLIYNLPTFH